MSPDRPTDANRHGRDDGSAPLLEESVDRLRTLTQIGLTPPDLSQGLLDALRTLGRIIFGGG